MTQWKFVNEQHEQQYNDATRLLNAEIDRQKGEAARLVPEFERLPEEIRRERLAWLDQHFAACRKPYNDLLVKILELATHAGTVFHS